MTRCIGGIVLCCGSGNALASGFALLEQSASRLGSAFAGTAAAADDASTLFYNPAGLSLLSQGEALLVASAIDVASQFRNTNSQPALGQPLGSSGSDAGGWNVVPAAYFALPVNDRLAVGLGINAPFGLKLEYDDGWIGRFQALKSEIQTYNVNPTLAWRVNDSVSVGIGINYQKIQAELTNSVNYTAVVAQGVQQLVAAGQLPPALAPGVIAANAALAGRASVRGDDGQWGFNAGILLELPSQTRIGLSYRSSIDYDIEGSVRFAPPTPTNPIGAAIVAAASQSTLASGRASVDIELPDSAILSLSQQIGPNLQLLADVAWTGWSSVQELRVVRDSGVTVSATPERWEDVWRVAVGGQYRLNDAWKLRAGVAYDETPVPTDTRTPRLPDPDRKWVAIGAQWLPTPQTLVDFGYAHLFSNDVRLAQNDGNTAVSGLLSGDQESSVDILSVQVTYRW